MTMSTGPRRIATLLAAVLSGTLFLTACGSDGGSSDPSGSGSDGYPVTVDSTYGEVTLERKPERIVVIGVDYVDMLAAIDEQPVAFAGSGEKDVEALLELYPWIAELDISGFDPEIITAEYKAAAEAIAVHEPDLIIGTPYYIGEQQYEQLSAIAPTYTTIFAADREWRDNLTDFGTLTGKSDDAAQAIADVEAEFAAARDQLPGLQGKTLSIADFYDGSLRLMPTYRWIEDLGLTPAKNQPKAGSPLETLSAENFSQFVGDVAVVATYDEESRASLEDDPRFPKLPSVKNDAMFLVDRPMIDAGLAAGPSSLTWLLGKMVPLLEESALNTGASG